MDFTFKSKLYYKMDDRLVIMIIRTDSGPRLDRNVVELFMVVSHTRNRNGTCLHNGIVITVLGKFYITLLSSYSPLKWIVQSI